MGVWAEGEGKGEGEGEKTVGAQSLVDNSGRGRNAEDSIEEAKGCSEIGGRKCGAVGEDAWRIRREGLGD